MKKVCFLRKCECTFGAYFPHDFINRNRIRDRNKILEGEAKQVTSLCFKFTFK